MPRISGLWNHACSRFPSGGLWWRITTRSELAATWTSNVCNPCRDSRLSPTTSIARSLFSTAFRTPSPPRPPSFSSEVTCHDFKTLAESDSPGPGSHHFHISTVAVVVWSPPIADFTRWKFPNCQLSLPTLPNEPSSLSFRPSPIPLSWDVGWMPCARSLAVHRCDLLPAPTRQSARQPAHSESLKLVLLGPWQRAKVGYTM